MKVRISKVHLILAWAVIGHLGINNVTSGAPGDQIFDRQLKDGWAIGSSAQTGSTGEVISKPGFDVSKWYPCQVPSTVMAALIANNEYPNIFMGDNISKVDAKRFATSWWFRNEFTLDNSKQNTELIFEGINYRANIWLNGRQIASADSIFGGFRIFKLNVSKDVTTGKNVLALEVFHPKPDEPSIGFVDWAPNPPDREMGLWRPVKIRISGTTVLDNIFVSSKIANENKEADLRVSADVINNTDQPVESLVKGAIGDIRFEKKVKLQPHQGQTIVFSSAEFPQLKIKNPRLWWTHDLGKPEMYDLFMETGNGNDLSIKRTPVLGSAKWKIILPLRGTGAIN
jgi:exo-1,4-beta-D-glucosaminidase